MQFLPPWDGTGLLHCRLRDFMPSPHVVEHFDHPVQWDHPPFTGQWPALQPFVQISFPVQFNPPWAGAGLLHALLRCITPCPQDTEHIVQFVQCDHRPFTGQCSTLQLWVKKLCPEHAFPPYKGAGLLQVLFRYLTPPPHVFEHADQGDQRDHPPCIGQGLRVHSWEPVLFPMHTTSALDVIWLLHVRFRSWIPFPQETEHSDHGDQSVQSTCTVQGVLEHFMYEFMFPLQTAASADRNEWLHFLWRERNPLPHVLEHADQAVQLDHLPLYGQVLILQVWVAVPLPKHECPLYEGEGRLHKRRRVITPFPQVDEQSVHSSQGDQCPLTGQWVTWHLLRWSSNAVPLQANQRGSFDEYLHNLLRFDVPQPHFLEQEDHGVQTAQTSSTGHALRLQLWVYLPRPLQGFPPFVGGGLVHDRTRYITPPPQDTLQGVQCFHADQTPSTGHASVLHGSDKEGVPTHEWLPWNCEAGMHDLWRVLVPPPQDWLHADHDVQNDQATKTGQVRMPHLWLSIEGPLHSWLLRDCVGLLHCLVREMIPPPHVLVHCDHVDQVVQAAPSMKLMKRNSHYRVQRTTATTLKNIFDKTKNR